MKKDYLHITGFKAKNFKPFVDTCLLKIFPITLFFGSNSSGKSALLSILPMLQQTLEDPNLDTPFIFSSETGIDLGIYEEVAYKHQVLLEKPVWFFLELSLTTQKPIKHSELIDRNTKDIINNLGFNENKFQVAFGASYNKKRRRIALTDFKIIDKERNTFIRLFRKTTAEKQRWHFESEHLSLEDFIIFWHHFIPFIML